MQVVQLPFVHILAQRLSAPQPLIQVVLGPRQVGKTTGVLQLQAEFHDRPVQYFSADETLNPGESWVLQCWQKTVQASDQSILIIDEIQRVSEWSLVLKRLYDEQKRLGKTKIKFVVLGSAALLLQKGLRESLAGRFEIISVPQWNYYDSQRLFGMSLETYLNYGGYPGSYELIHDRLRWRAYIQHAIVEAVIGKDILSQVTVKSPALFRQAFEIVSQYPSQEISYNKILGQLQSRGNTDLVKTYLKLYEQTFLINTLEKYTHKTILRKSSSPKIIPGCPALVTFHSEAPANQETRGRLFELAVGMELLRLGLPIYYWRENDRFEVDFVLRWKKTLVVIEVKSGRKKSPVGLDRFVSKNKNAVPVFVDQDNFLQLSKNGALFLDSICP